MSKKLGEVEFRFGSAELEAVVYRSGHSKTEDDEFHVDYKIEVYADVPGVVPNRMTPDRWTDDVEEEVEESKKRMIERCVREVTAQHPGVYLGSQIIDKREWEDGKKKHGYIFRATFKESWMGRIQEGDESVSDSDVITVDEAREWASEVVDTRFSREWGSDEPQNQMDVDKEEGGMWDDGETVCPVDGCRRGVDGRDELYEHCLDDHGFWQEEFAEVFE